MRTTLGLYIARRFLTNVGGAFASVFALVVIVDLIELMRNNRDGTANFLDVFGMALLHAPSITIAAAPFTILLATMTSYAMLARTSELVVTRAAGVSVWRLLSPVLISAILLGVLVTTVYNPIASAFTARFERLETKYFDRSASMLAVSADGLWLRQGDDLGQIVIRAARASANVDRLWEVTLFRFDADDHLTSRLDAATAELGNREWILTDVREWPLVGLANQDGAGSSTMEGLQPTVRERHTVETNLTVERILDSFAAPETISFWDLPAFIDLLERSGFASDRHRMHFSALLSVPAVFAAMVLIGSAFSMRHARFGGLGLMALGAVLAGFSYFFLSDIASALGASGSVPVSLAAWAPPLSAALAALGLLLHLEDG